MDTKTKSTKSRPKVLIVGGTGFLGNEIGLELVQAGYDMNLVSRSKRRPAGLSYPAERFTWQEDGKIPDEAVRGVAAIINLAGESIASGRWTRRRRQKIMQSRVDTSLAVVAAANKQGVGLVIQASAVGYYGDTGSQVVDENSSAGEGFLSEVSVQWENALAGLGPTTRKVVMRLGVIFGTRGGALPKILDPYIVGAGAAVGSGKQFLSWIHAADVCRFVQYAIEHKEVQGHFNLTSPEPVTYGELHEELVRYFGGFRWAKIPDVLLKIALGSQSQMLLTSQRVAPKKTQATGFQFKFSSLNTCIKDLLGSHNPGCAIMDTKQWVPEKLPKVWGFFSTEKNLETLTPAFLQFRVLEMSTPTIQEGSEITYRLKIRGVPVKWKSKIINFKAGESFQDIQLKGPYKIWHHTHDFSAVDGGTLIHDFVKYKVPFGVVGGMLAYFVVKKDVEKIFSFRQLKIAGLFKKSSPDGSDNQKGKQENQH